MSGNVVAPAFQQPKQTGDIVGFNLQNSSELTRPSSYITFGQEFAVGTLRVNDPLVATINGVAKQVQVDPKTFYADGSIEMAVLTIQSPVISAHSTLQGMLSVSSGATVAQPPVDMLAMLLSHSLICNVSLSDGTAKQVDLIAAIRAASINGTASSWLSGPQATQLSVSIPITGSFRLTTAFTTYADGTFSAQIGFNNDIAMSTSGGAVTYSASIVQDGKTVFSQPVLTQYQYQNWSTTVYQGSGLDSHVNIQHDPMYLARVGAIPNYDFSNGVSTSVIQSETDALNSPGWGTPLSNNAVETYMPTTGGRGDIGPTTQGNAAWLITQDPTAAAYALGQADTAGAIPWNMWVPSSRTYLNTTHAADIWIDGRAGPSSYTTGLTQQVDQTNSGWTAESAHQPDLSYYAYLMTGDHTYLDSLNAQASWSITNTWPGFRGIDQIIVNGPQVRADAWSLREIDEAAYANPSGSVEKEYFTEISNANWHWLVAQIPTWTILQGQAYGQVEGTYGNGDGSTMAPWQQDYFASTAIQAAEHGNADALTFLNWESNFLVGRFLQQANGFNPRDGITYNLHVGSNGDRYKTWSEIATATTNSGNSNGTGWSQSNGDYGQLALHSLAGIISLTGSAQAIQAYNWLITSGAPYIDAHSRASDVQFDILPKLPPNLTLAADGTIVNADSSSATSNVSLSPVQDTIPTSALQPSSPPSSNSSFVPSTVTPSSLVLNVSEDAWQGDAQFAVTVDGKQVGGTYTATASHQAGQTQAISIPTSLSPGQHTVGVTFLNDAYGGTAGTDRNLYLDSASYNGAPIAGSTSALYSNGTHNLGITTPNAPSLVLNVSEDAWQGDAQFAVTVDGKQVGGTYTATASHQAGQTQAISIPTSLSPGQHTVGVTFLNDAYGGTAGTDRNLYLDSASYNGAPIAGSTSALYSNGTHNLGITTPNAPSLVLNVSEDAWQGDAQFAVTVDGKQVGGTYTATASHQAGQTQAISIPTSLSPGQHTVGVTFLNDAYGGTAGTDRNLYLDSASYNGAPIAGSTSALYSNGTHNLGITTPNAPSLVLNVSEDAWQGDAQFAVTVDGKQVGGTYTATASHQAGQTQAISIPTSLSPGQHTVGVTFLNDAYGGTAGTDRNLYLDSASYNGAPIAGSTSALYSNGTHNLGITTPNAPSLVLNVSEDAWQGDAQFAVTVDGKQVGGTYTATASHQAGQTQAISIPTSLSPGQHTVGVTFLNDAYGGTAGTDRNLYLDSASYNGAPIAGSTSALYSNGTHNIDLLVASSQ